MREIRGHLEELYGIDVSPDLISAVTDAVLEEVAEWQDRPLEAGYPLVFFDALRVKIRDEGLVRNKAVYIALGVLADGTKEILGLWIEQTEGAKFWLRVMNELKNRGVARHPDRRRRWPEGLSRGDHRRVPADGRADLHRSSDPPSLRFRVLEGPQARRCRRCRAIYRANDAAAGLAALEAFEAGSLGPEISRPSPRAGGATGSRSSRSSPSPRACAGSSTPPTPSRR